MKRISKILFTLGLILILGSVSLNMHTKYKQNQAKNNFNQKIENDEEIKNINLGDEIGLIDIPSLNKHSDCKWYRQRANKILCRTF